MRLANCTCAKVEEYLRHSKTIVIGVGSIENHGRHMPLGTDTMIPDKILELLEERSGVMIAPTVGIDPFTFSFMIKLIIIVALSSFGIAGVGGGATFAAIMNSRYWASR